MMEILLGIFLGVTLVVMYIWYRVYQFTQRIEAHLDTVIDHVKSKIVPVVVERENGSIYCYAKEDHQFICQGANLDEIRKAFELRFPEKTAFLAGGDEEVLEELRTQIQEEVKV